MLGTLGLEQDALSCIPVLSRHCLVGVFWGKGVSWPSYGHPVTADFVVFPLKSRIWNTLRTGVGILESIHEFTVLFSLFYIRVLQFATTQTVIGGG